MTTLRRSPISGSPRRNAQSIQALEPARDSTVPLRLSAEEERRYLNLATSVNAIDSVGDYRKWIREKVRSLFPHEMMISGIGSIVGNRITVDYLVGVGYPQRYIDQIPLNVDLLNRPVVAEWYRLRKPQLIEESAQGYSSLSEMERWEIATFKLRNLAVHGLIDLDGRKGSYFSFSKIPGVLSLRHGQVLELLVPHMHQALLKATHGDATTELNASQTLDSLSPRERDILAWVIAGKTNREIAVRLKRSEMTIRNQVHSILVKLNVPNRTQAVSKAIGLGFKSRYLVNPNQLK